ncbi:hypothetical protein [Psychromonas sp. SR45-3]|uniref:hypothetical protein n=1 Tax=Psychromonas sp. SR45-3 TaxID=2760930 RepID=UPI0015FD778E|nr:hypothetical protein [Psychromonas sp. SR45-3]MBB1274069.1 hypothetical protein [Psychromonas sp. SR45-3]
MEKNYCAVNTKYYKNNNVGEIDHVLRNMLENINAIECLTKNNFGYSFGEGDIKSHYEEKLEEARNANKLALQENSNTFIDSVLIFDSQKFNECLENGKQDEIEQATKDFMLEFKEKFGFEPIGFEFHLDEGTTIDVEKLTELDEDERKKYVPVENDEEDFTTEYIKQNIHAHAVFLNYDFEKNKSCLRNMRKNHWSESQDMLHKHFKKFGFDRGEKKQTNKKDHKTKADYVRELELKTVELVGNHSKNLQDQDQLLDQIIEHQNDLDRFENLGSYAEKIKTFVVDFASKQKKLTQKLLALPGADKIKSMAVEIYEALTKDTTPPEQENVLEEVEELDKKEEVNKIDIETQKAENLKKEKEVEDKKKKVKNIKNRRKHGRKTQSYKPKPPRPSEN